MRWIEYHRLTIYPIIYFFGYLTGSENNYRALNIYL
jgi:hypothetical protein